MYSKAVAKELRHNFWKAFSDYTKFYSKQIGEPISWILYDTGIKGLDLKFVIEKKYYAVALEVNESNVDKRFDIYILLDKYKNIINEGFGDELIWEEEFNIDENKVVSRIYIDFEGVKYHNPDNWPVIFKFMAENMYKLQSNFLDIEPILKEEIS